MELTIYNRETSPSSLRVKSTSPAIRMTSKGQFYLNKLAAELLHIGDGDEIEFGHEVKSNTFYVWKSLGKKGFCIRMRKTDFTFSNIRMGKQVMNLYKCEGKSAAFRLSTEPVRENGEAMYCIINKPL